MSCAASLWRKFATRGFSLRPVDHFQRSTEDGPQLRKTIGVIDLLLFGVGAIVGSGAFVLTGAAAKEHAGPSIVLSYLFASLAALFSALCYSEFAVDIPMAGTAFNYMMVVFGDFVAWISAINLILEYTLSAASVAKGIAGYMATLFGWESGALLITFDSLPYIVIDISAFVVVALLSALLCVGIRESATTNNVVTLVNIATMLLVIGLALPRFDSENIAPFAPFGVKGMFTASSIVFFSYIGFDSVATIAEEVENPKRNLPIGIIGSLVISTVLYLAMSLAIVGMVSYEDIDVNAAFSVAFSGVGINWAPTVISIGALAGILTSLLLCILGQARIFMALGREGFLPNWLATVNSRTRTPINATLTTFVLAGLPSLFLDIEILSEMVSIGTLFVFFLVCLGVLWKTYYIPCSEAPKTGLVLVLSFVTLMSIGVGLSSELGGGLVVTLCLLGAWLIGTLALLAFPILHKTDKFTVPLKPLIPSAGILFTVHLMCSLGWPAYLRFGVWQIVGIVFYLCYGVHTPRSHEVEPMAVGLLKGYVSPVNSE
ncbi:hypothetical protein BSKO_09256 [Bryopsis sp. KO-2023]|nr:hypothetical protein BSKO_09256 [Bryopsis sp. KO-2023]